MAHSRRSIDGFSFSTPRKDASRVPPLRANVPAARPRTAIPSPQAMVKPIIGPSEIKSSLLNISLPNNSYVPGPTRASQSSKEQPKKRKHPFKWYAVRATIGVVLLLIIIGGWLGGRILGNLDKVFHGNAISDAQAIFSSTKLKGESQGRVNILLAGDSSDDPGHAGADLTDSIMVVSINTKSHTGFLLSIPRDTWVEIPGMGHEKINAANTATNFSQSGYPNGGMGQLEEIVSSDFGIPIDYYSLIDYTAFRDAVNAVGSISINIQSNDPRGLYDPNTSLKLPNGMVTLDGQEALNLARARGDGYGSYGFPQADYDRTEHQRQMLAALELKAKSAGVLANPIKVGQLFDAIGNNVKTDLTLADVLRFVQITKGMDVANLQSLALTDSGSNPLLQNYTAPDGEDALIPSDGLDDFSQIQQYYDTLTSSNATVSSVAGESPSVVVLNASDVIGLAHKEATSLQDKGFNVVGITDANNEYTDSMIVDNTGNTKPESRKALQQIFSKDTTLSTSTTTPTEATEAQGYNADFVVILGKNWDTTSTVAN